MPVVRMPDGANVRFDDNMSKEQIRDLISKKFPDINQKIDVSKLSAKNVMNEDGLNSSPMEKLDLMWTLTNLIPDSFPMKNQIDLALMAGRTIKNTDFKNLGSEAAKSVGRQSTDLLVGGTGFYAKMAGTMLQDKNPEDTKEESIVSKARNATANTLINFGELLEKYSEKINNSDLLRPEEGLYEGTFKENPNLNRVADLVMSGVSSLVGIGALSLAVNPIASLMLFSGVDAKEVFEGAIEKGESKGKALSLWTGATLGTAALEKTGAEKVFGMKITKNGFKKIVDSAKSTSKKIVESMLSEGTTEGLQTVYQNAVVKYGYDETKDLMENVIESIIGGVGGAGIIASANYGYQAFAKKANRMNMPQSEQDKILNAIAQEISGKPSILEAPLQEQMKKTYDSFEKMIEQMGDTPRAAALREMKKDLDEGYNKYFNQLKEIMPEEQAKANAALIRGSALFFSDLEGISVKDWFEKKAPQIVQTDLSKNEEDIPFFQDEVYKEDGKADINSPEFKAWSNNAPFYEANKAEERKFKTGKPLVAEVFHGTQRADRVGSVFLPERATSGPMAFSTDTRSAAEGYANTKRDTSIYNETEGDFHKYFKVKIPNYNAVTLDRLWAILPYSKKQEMREKAPHITTDENGENIIYDENETYGNGGYNAEYHGNNALEALVDAWMMSGSLWNEEEKFQKVMELAGLGEYEIQYVDPNAVYPKVYELYVEMQKPLVSYDVPKKVVDALDKASKKQTRDVAGIGTDFWDKNTRDPIAWIEALKEGDVYVWTSIPDWVTNTLKKMGYDGIVDTGGKGGGTEHNVFIPFTSTQYKSVYNKGTFSKENPDIYYQPELAENVIDNFDKNAPNKSFVRTRTGQITHGIISEEIAKQAGIQPGEIRVYNELYKHLSKVKPEEKISRLAQIKKFGYNNPIDFIDDVMENLSKIQKGSDDSLLLTGNIGKNNTVAVKLVEENGFYRVTTIMPRRKISNKKTIWEAAIPLQNETEQPAIIGPNGSVNIAPSAENVNKSFRQGENNPLGAYSNRIIYLNKTANASTLPHELAHFWSDELKKNGSPRALEILKQADVWEENEFERKYSIKEENGKYIVTDKSGQVIYDKMGEGFETEEDAKSYAKEELFARGFEQYIKEGKAPNKTMRVVFRNFFNWLKKIYHDVKALDIKLSNPMRSLYADILGGTNIDTFLSEDVEGFIEARKEVGDARVEQVKQIIDQAINTPKKTTWQRIKQAYQDFDLSKTWTDVAVPLSTRAKRIAPTFRNTLRRYVFDTLNTKRKYYQEIEPMLKKWKDFSVDDATALDLALKNNVPEIRDEILKKYNAIDDFGKVKKVLEDIYIKAGDAGIDVGYIEDYFPRKVKDVNGLLAYLQGLDEWSSFEEARKNEDPNNMFDAEEQAEFIDKFLRGIVRPDPSSKKYSSEKERRIYTIDNGINQFYEGSMQSLINYVEGMNSRIAVMKFFGRNDKNVDDSIGAFIGYMLDTNQIKASQVDEVKKILDAVFKAKGVSTKWLKGARDVAYLYTMGGVNTAITQIDDLFVSMYKSGVWNTIQTLAETKKVTKRDIGLDSIAAEFMDGSGTSKAVNWVFKKNGIDFIDGIGKNALLNGVLRKAQKMNDQELTSYLAPIMEEQTEQTLKDIREDNLSDNVRFFLFNELSDMQPISLLEMPETYNTGGNRRIFYMLKSFMLKRIDTLRNESFDKIRSANREEKIEGLRNLYRLALLMMFGGATKDLLIDFMYGRAIDLKDTVVNNLLGMVGISKYNIYQVREEGLGHTLAIFAFPPLFQVAEDLSGDVNKMIAGKRELKDFEVFKGLPIIGRFYYWWLGGGKTKTEKKKAQEKKKSKGNLKKIVF